MPRIEEQAKICWGWGLGKATNIYRALHDGRGMIGNRGKNYSEWVSKMRFFDNFSRSFQFQLLDFSWSKSKFVFWVYADNWRNWSQIRRELTTFSHKSIVC